MRIRIDFINEEVDPTMATVTDMDTGKQYDVPAEHFRWRNTWLGDVPAGWFEGGREFHRSSIHDLVGMTLECKELIDQSYTVHHFKPVGLGKMI